MAHVKLTDEERRARNREYARRWRSNPANRAKDREATRRWLANPTNRAKDRAKALAWKKANPEKHRANRLAWQKAHPEKNRSASLAWQKANPEKCAAKYHARRAKKRGATGRYTAEQMAARSAILGGACLYCGGEYQHDDHFLPLSTYLLNSAENMVPACTHCNTSKGDSRPLEWLERREREGKPLSAPARLALELSRGRSGRSIKVTREARALVRSLMRLAQTATPAAKAA